MPAIADVLVRQLARLCEARVSRFVEDRVGYLDDRLTESDELGGLVSPPRKKVGQNCKDKEF